MGPRREIRGLCWEGEGQVTESKEGCEASTGRGTRYWVEGERYEDSTERARSEVILGRRRECWEDEEGCEAMGERGKVTKTSKTVF